MRGSRFVVAGITVLVLGLGGLGAYACGSAASDLNRAIFPPPAPRSVTIDIDDDRIQHALGFFPYDMDSPCVTTPDDESLAVSGSSARLGLRITIDIRNGVGTVRVVDDSGALLLRGRVDDFNWDPWAQFFDAEGDYRSEYESGRFRLEGNCYYLGAGPPW